MERVAGRDVFCSSLFPVHDTKCGRHLVAGLFGLAAGSENGIACCADVINDDYSGPWNTIPSFDKALHTMTFRFLAHDKGMERRFLKLADDGHGSRDRIGAQRQTTNSI